MAEVLSSWAVAPGTNLVGVARMDHAPGEAIEVNCRGKIVVFVVLDGEYHVVGASGQATLDRGAIYVVDRSRISDHPESALPVAASASASMLWASFSASTTALNAAVDGLPPALRIPASDLAEDVRICNVLTLLREEFGSEVCGRELLSGHLFEALFLYILRHWFGRFPATPCAFDAFGDPVLARVVERIHQAPEHPWTVDELAAVAGLSRAAFARRFKTGVGDSPLGYVMRWRLNLAAQMLDQAMDIRHVCDRIGYASEFAFSRAFARHHGLPPSRYRNRRAGA